MGEVDWSHESTPKDFVGFILWSIREFVVNMDLEVLVFLVVDLICIFFAAYKFALLKKVKKTSEKELEKVKKLLSEADEFLTEEEEKDLRDGQSHRYTRELHEQKMAEIKTVRKKVRKLLARTSVLLKQIKAEQRRMELQLAGREMKRRIQAFDQQNGGDGDSLFMTHLTDED